MTNLRRDLKSKRLRRTFLTNSFAGAGVLAVLFGIYDVIDPDRISKIPLPLPAVVIVLALSFGVWKSWPRPIEETYSTPSTEIRILVGDLFETSENLVIGTCDTFDTATPHVIDKNSIQGQFLDRVYDGDVMQLDHDISSSLSQTEPIESVSKEGKTSRYPIGTIATIRSGRRHFFLMGFTVMSETNQAHGTADNLWISLSRLWLEVHQHANGSAVRIPALGGGQSRLSQIVPAQDAIRLIIFSFMFASRQRRVCERLDIVVSPRDADRIDMLELQSFLTSLKAS